MSFLHPMCKVQCYTEKWIGWQPHFFVFFHPMCHKALFLHHRAFFTLKSGKAGSQPFLSVLHPMWCKVQCHTEKWKGWQPFFVFFFTQCGAKYNVAVKSGLAGSHSECKTNKLQRGGVPPTNQFPAWKSCEFLFFFFCFVCWNLFLCKNQKSTGVY